MTPRISNKSLVSLVGARFIVPVLPGRAVPLVPKCNDQRALSCLSLLPALALLSARLESAQPASAAKVSASTSTPRAMSSGEAYSSGRWLYPPRQGINNIATGAMRDIKSES
jgi:hypothetical protein